MKVISLGWGVQSFTLACMVALGELEPVDYVIHSDTTWERQSTYQFAAQWTPWLEERGVKVVTVSDAASAMEVITGKPDIPAFTTYSNGNLSGMLRRQCTGEWKIDPMRGFIRAELTRLGIQKEAGCVEQWLGITVDEIQRAKPSDVQWITSRFPLLEKNMYRQSCILWLQKNGLPVPPKSACVFCPYHRRQTWVEMKQQGGPDWETAVRVDEAIRNKRPNYISYVHTDRIPLIELKTAEDFGGTQGNFLDLVNAECDSGFCFL